MRYLIVLIFVVIMSQMAMAEIISPNQERTCVNGRCTESIYGAPVFAKDSSGQWVNSSDVLSITRDSDDIIFHYNGIEGNFNITFESGAIYNGNYFPMATVKSNFPQLNFNFPSSKERTRHKYAVNITNINATSINPNLIESITLTYKTHSGFTLSQLRTETGSFTARNIMNLAFSDLLDSGFTISTNISERRIYIGNISANIVNGNLFLDPTVTIINETGNMTAYHADTNGDCDDPLREGLYVGRPTKPYSDWTAFTAANYQALGLSDDSRIATGSAAACKQFVFNYTLNSLVTATNLNWINFTWEGQMGVVSCGDDKIMFWNITNQTWSTTKVIAITTSDTTHNFNTSNITTFYNTTSREVLLGVTCNPTGAFTFRTDFASLEYNYNEPVPNLNSITLNQTVLRPNQNLNITANVTNTTFASVHLDIINPSGTINVSNQSMTLQTPDIYYFGYTTNNTNGNWTIFVYANTTETSDSINFSSTSFRVNLTPNAPTNLTEVPSDPQVFGERTYFFNATMCDDDGANDIGAVKFQLNNANNTVIDFISSGTNCRIYQYNTTTLGMALHNYTWYVEDSLVGSNVSSNNTGNYTITAGTIQISGFAINDTYINFGESINLTVNVSANFSVVIATIQASNLFNVTLNGTGQIRSVIINSGRLGNSTTNATVVNITRIYADGQNYTETSNATGLNFTYGLTTLSGVADVPDPQTNAIGDSVVFNANYLTSDGSTISSRCELNYASNLYNMSIVAGLQQVAVSTNGLSAGTYTYSINCTNDNYQRQYDTLNTNDITASGSGTESGGDSGGGGNIVEKFIETLKNITTEIIIGDGVCDVGEDLNNSLDCKSSISQSTGIARIEILLIGGALIGIVAINWSANKKKRKRKERG